MTSPRTNTIGETISAHDEHEDCPRVQVSERELLPCLSIRQPYAWLIVNGIKPVENRRWPTRFRGRILIHASANYPKRDYNDDRDDYHERWGIPYPDRDAMVGGIVGSATVVDCVTEHSSEWWIGPYGFVLEKPRAFAQLIPYKGALGIFNVPSAIVRAAASLPTASKETQHG